MMIPGVAVAMGGQDWIVPPLTLGQLRRLMPKVRQLTEIGASMGEAQINVLIDIVNATASSFLGLTLACAQCHNHKFDALTQRDYYRFQGFFVKGQVNNLLLKDPEMWKKYEAAVPRAYWAIPPGAAPARTGGSA